MAAPGRKKPSTLSATCRGIMIGMGLCYLLRSKLEGKDRLFHSSSFEPARELEEEEEEIDPDIEATSIVCIIILLIFLTIAFEEIEELIVESSPREFKPIVESLFGEMTVLGFLSVCTFCITKTPFPFILSRHLFGEDEFLVEIFEMVHFCLFFIMVFFVAQVLFLLKESIKIQKGWNAMDRACMELRYGNGSYPHSFDHDELEAFAALRDEFILERSMDPPFEPAAEENRVSEDFNFGRYLSICLGINVSRVVHVDIVSWVAFIFLTLGLYGVMLILEGDLMILGWVWVAVGWMDLIFFRFIFNRYLIGIANALSLPSDPTENRATTEQESLLSHGGASSSSLPAWCGIDLDLYKSSRSWLKRYLCPRPPTRQDGLFWLEERGPHLHLVVLQLNLVFRGVYGATLILIFIPAFHAVSWLNLALYLVVAFLPILCVVGQVRRVFAVMSIVGSIGSLRRPQVVSDVIRKEKTLLLVRAFLVLDKMHSLATNETEESHLADGTEVRELTHLETMEVGATFDAFDRNGDGKMSLSELERVMHTLGSHTSERKMHRVLSTLDLNGDGHATKDEFLEWYRRYMIPKDHVISLEDRAHSIFHMFDKDGSGKISISEFKKTIDTLRIGFTVDEVGQIVQELDEDGNIMIGIEEFHELLEKHYPEELEGHHHE